MEVSGSIYQTFEQRKCYVILGICTDLITSAQFRKSVAFGHILKDARSRETRNKDKKQKPQKAGLFFYISLILVSLSLFSLLLVSYFLLLTLLLLSVFHHFNKIPEQILRVVRGRGRARVGRGRHK